MYKTMEVSDIKAGRFGLPALAWAAMLLVSLLPDILSRELTGELPVWLVWVKIGLMATLLLASLLWSRIRALSLFFVVLLAVNFLEFGVNRFYNALNYQIWLSGLSPFLQDTLAVQIQRLTTAVLMMLIMLALLGSFKRFFFVKGKLDAEAAPIPLILDKPSSWRILGPAISAAMCLGLLVFIFAFGSLPSRQSLVEVIPLLPFVLLLAASNAFGEEMIYRAPWLGALEGPLGALQALLITSVYFGVAHFYGVPYGVVGVVMAFIPGWLMGKSMLETRGFFWAWVIHLSMDMVIFFFMALGSVVPGG
jgi:membrane protease YdiL (CAAX protease family)